MLKITRCFQMFFLLEKKKEYEEENLKPKPLINGNDLIALGLKPGPQFKVILEEAWELQLENTFKNREEALEWVKGYVKKKNTG